MEQQNILEKKHLKVHTENFFEAYKKLIYSERRLFRNSYFPLNFVSSEFTGSKQPDRWKNQQAGNIAMSLSELRNAQAIWDKLKFLNNPLQFELEYVIL